MERWKWITLLYFEPKLSGPTTQRSPFTADRGESNADAAHLVVSIKSYWSLYLQEAVVEPEELIPRLKAISNANPDVRIFVRGDRAVSYGEVLSVMGRIQSAGFEKVALIAKLPEKQ